jgi:hypothetical protein
LSGMRQQHNWIIIECDSLEAYSHQENHVAWFEQLDRQDYFLCQRDDVSISQLADREDSYEAEFIHCTVHHCNYSTKKILCYCGQFVNCLSRSISWWSYFIRITWASPIFVASQRPWHCHCELVWSRITWYLSSYIELIFMYYDTFTLVLLRELTS